MPELSKGRDIPAKPGPSDKLSKAELKRIGKRGPGEVAQKVLGGTGRSDLAQSKDFYGPSLQSMNARSEGWGASPLYTTLHT